MIGRARFRQTLVGSFREVAAGSAERPICLELEAAEPALLPGLRREIAVRGRCDAKGLADARPLTGRVLLGAWSPFAAEYRLETSSNQGLPLAVFARRKLSLREPLWSASTVSGELSDGEGRRLASLELRIDFRREIRRWVGS